MQRWKLQQTMQPVYSNRTKISSYENIVVPINIMLYDEDKEILQEQTKVETCTTSHHYPTAPSSQSVLFVKLLGK